MNTRPTSHLVSALLVAALVAGCTSTTDQPAPAAKGGAKAEAAPSHAAATPSMLDEVKQLAGTWEMKDQNGATATIVYSVGSGGSAVREIMFPGQPHEMTNMYHMDGNTLLVTHYCAGGNQPRMRATSASAGVIDFKYDSVTNLSAPDASFMGGLKLVIVDKDHLKQEWRSVEKGVVTEGPVFELTRKH